MTDFTTHILDYEPPRERARVRIVRPDSGVPLNVRADLAVVITGHCWDRSPQADGRGGSAILTERAARALRRFLVEHFPPETD